MTNASLPPEPFPQSEIILYQTEDGRTRIQCRFENEALWLTQALIAELFQVTVPTVNEHLKGIFAEGELAPAATIRNFRIVRLEGRREAEFEYGKYRNALDAAPRAVDVEFEKAAKALKGLPKPRKAKGGQS